MRVISHDDIRICLYDEDSFFDVFPIKNGGVDLIMCDSFGYFALIEYGKEKHIIAFPTKEWFKEWLVEIRKNQSYIKRHPKILFEWGKE